MELAQIEFWHTLAMELDQVFFSLREKYTQGKISKTQGKFRQKTQGFPENTQANQEKLDFSVNHS